MVYLYTDKSVQQYFTHVELELYLYLVTDLKPV